MKPDVIFTILIADDNPDNLKVLTNMLEARGFDVRVAMDGVQALSSIRTSPPDLVMLDIHMPEMDGYQVCKALKEDPELENIPVIFVSALSEPFNKILGFQQGAVDYIEKPFQLEEVEARVSTHLKLQHYQKQLKAQAFSSEERFRLTFENAAVGIAHARMDGSFLIVNNCFCTILGYEEKEFDNLNLQDLVAPDEQEEMFAAFQALFNGQTATIFREKAFVRKDTTTIWCKATVSLARTSQPGEEYAIMVLEDINERVEAEKKRKIMEGQLRQAQRLEAIGTLASGIAHDFNNILGVIIGYTDLAIRELPDDSPAREDLKSVKTAADRARDLVQHIFTSCRQVEQGKNPIRIDFIVKEALELLKASLPAFIRIQTRIEKCCPVMADPTQIHQVVMNLCTNAFHAMEEKGGTLTVSLEMESVFPEAMDQTCSLTPGQYNLLTISDTGSGIKPHLLERIFEPYFTTKSMNKGTGLGLSVVHGIVKNHGGEIFAFSEEGRGATFQVYLPCIEERTASDVNDEDGGEIRGGNEHLLIVDDDVLYLEMMTDLLRSLGYEVTAAGNGEQALYMLRKTPDLFDCLLTDMTMPGINGAQLACKVLEMVPDLPIIMFTGFSEAINCEQAAKMGIKAFLMKPVILSRLAATLRSILDRNKDLIS